MMDLFWLSDARWAVLAPSIPKNERGTRRASQTRYDGRLHRERWRVEAAFCRLEDVRPATPCDDRRAMNFAFTVAVDATITFWF